MSLTNAVIEAEFSLSEEWFETHELEEIMISENISFVVNIPPPPPVRHGFAKTCTGYDPATRTFTWQITFTPNDESPITRPITFTDTLDVPHTYVPDSLALTVGGTATDLNNNGSILDVTTPFTYTYNGPTDAGAIVLTYETQLDIDEIITNYAEPSTAENTVTATWDELPVGDHYTVTASKTVTPADKTLLTKIAVSSDAETASTTKINGNTIYWRVTINTYGLPITELYMHDLMPPGLTLDKSEVVPPATQQSGESPTPVIITPIPGSPDYPPVPEGTILVETEDGDFLEIDEDGTPLGTWHYDDEEEVWIFEPYVPLGTIPATSDTRIVPFAMAAFILSVMGAALLTLRNCFGCLVKSNSKKS